MVTAATFSFFETVDPLADCSFERSMEEVEEFETFVRNYQNMVFSASARILGSLADAEDITQEVFLKAYERFQELRISPTAGGWLKTVATNLSINHLNRYRARWRFFSEQEKPIEIAAEAPEKSDRQEMLELALRKLPEYQRVPLVLFHFQEMSYDEIAAKLGISLAKVKTDIHRGKETLRKILTK